MSVPMVVKHRYVGVRSMKIKAARGHLSAHLKYIEHRRRDETESLDDRRIFDAKSEVVNRAAAINDIMDHAGMRDAYYHKVMLSPGPDAPVADYRQWTRDLMHDLEEKQGKTLHWYAVQHRNTEHFHVHVVIAGTGERFDTGQQEAVILRPDDYAFLKECGRAHSEQSHRQLLQEALQEIESRDDTIKSQQELLKAQGRER
jgi:hypothetical protein